MNKQKYWLRCPVCGKKSHSENFKKAGSHKLCKQYVIGLGRKKGFKNIYADLNRNDLELIKEAVEKALKSLQK